MCELKRGRTYLRVLWIVKYRCCAEIVTEHRGDTYQTAAGNSGLNMKEQPYDLSILKQMAYSAGGACVGGLVGGPPGAMIGGIAGSIVGYCKSDKYDSMLKILRNLSDVEKKELVKKIQKVVGSSTIEALTSFLASKDKSKTVINVLRALVEHKAG